MKSCQQVLAPANQYLKEQEAKQGSGEIDLNNPLAKPRIPYEILFAIGGWSAGSPTNFVETYDTRCSIPSLNRKQKQFPLIETVEFHLIELNST